MTEEFKKHASSVIDAAVLSEKSRLMNLVGAAYSEGEKHAEVNRITEIVGEALQQFYYDGVFCGDCFYFEPDRCGGASGVCHNPRFGDGHGNYGPPEVNEEFHCADGERRETCQTKKGARL